MGKIIVLAGSRKQFEQYLASNGLTDSEAIYGWSESVMAGIEASKIVEIGNFYERPDASQLKESANRRLR